MPYQKIPAGTKTTIIEAHGRDEEYIDLARQLGVKWTTAYSIIRRYQQHDAVVRPRGRKSGATLKVDEEMKEVVVDIVEQYPA